ncbi:GNAT superfamily N-acetyltransferase [Rhizobium leguminosarum]|uniref:GNAT superfamily N-acetyltransferase n=1 Tax=Rhizobium leguminosarum TaxID=384 RepID=A0AAE2MNU9_RHILE|nr:MULTISPECIES: GNAT family N-acetyltransferase [Rhizobium]MBB4293148.1 GNAT superfamily N-acetyltransferase [Rhizobium leguminosarum]MBB4300029.1 GNAT superfamily N-acetyltransferase [Rhizobium leguminosarum]MBB4311155.1 GNAT superfamily N-acetyltransferase [Rhizobium leguminosarum]MBB4435382.1 GNAT superfamily N-acetyltransferase [Rhizobium esperanzae]MBB4532314.1 GNAT superfamily N-acetyltransferase [Rhizobium leguminosarum]
MGRTVEILTGKAELCRSIMGALPDWFSEPEVIEASAAAVEDLPVFGYVEADVVTALMALKPHLPGAVEIALIATRPEYHGRGAGRHLLDEAERFGHQSGARLLTVKTLAPRDRDEPQFEATRRFYDRNGFVRAEVFATLWHEDHPCLFMVKPLAGGQLSETAP